MQIIQNLIGGEFTPPHSGKYLDNYHPSRGLVYSKVPDSNVEDVNQAVQAAAVAFQTWSKTSPLDRARILRKIADGILSKLDELAKAESIDSGKPISLAKSLDIPRSATNFEFFADAITQFHGDFYRTNSQITNQTEYQALGVVACISPWNLPLYLFTWKIAPALAAGNTVVAKPSEITPMTAYLLGEIVKDAGLPPGVLNILHGTGPGVGNALINHPEVKAISFTGSTATGRIIAASAAKTFKKVSLELGGKNPNIIFADANLDKALETTVRSTFSNQGQICLCGSRIFIERSIYAEFRDRLVSKTKELIIGDPQQEATQMGALVSKPHLDKVMSFIEIAKKESGKILCGGKVPKLSGEISMGYFLEPTLIEGLPSESIVNQEEIFGPVATLIPFDNEKELLKMVNSTKYGLSASIWTSDISRAQRISKQIEAGVVWINCWMIRDLRTPFGGVKESGVGREGGEHALKFFSEVKNICIME